MGSARTALLLAATVAFVAAPGAQAQTKVRLDVEGTVLTATMEASPTAKDFLALLPITVTLKDYATTEKLVELPRKLTTQGAPPGHDPDVGDLTYYAPWGTLGIYYNDFGFSKGLVKLGRIEGNLSALEKPGPVKVTIRLN